MTEKPAKADQVLEIEPKNELFFKPPYTEIATEYLTLFNPSDLQVCFKIKTTAPKRYCVRPNSGIIDPKNSAKIAVMLQPSTALDSQQIKEFKNKHKFMVQTTFLYDRDVNQETLWKKVDPASIMESKLKCVFDLNYIESNENSDDNKDSNPASLPDSTKNPVEESTNGGGDAALASFVSIFPKQQSTLENSNLIEDNRKLRDEVTLLRQELMQVKEEGLKKRINNNPKSQGPTYGGDLLEKSSASNDQMILKNNTHILFFALFFFVIGVIYSKFLL